MSSNSLFIINSPFQVLCAIEAISYYGEQNPFFLLFDCGDSRGKIEKLLKNNGFNYRVLPFTGTKDLIRSIKKIYKSSSVYLGDFFSYDQYLIGLLKSTTKAKLTFLDDGASTLSLMPDIGRKRFSGFSRRTIAYLTLELLSNLKCIQKTFFSIYDISNFVKFRVDKNDFSFLSKNCSITPQNGIYIIGTNSSALEFKDMTYDELLRKVYIYIRNKYSNTTVYYCPHRRDTNNYEKLFDELNFHVFSTDISVEVDFVSKNITPRLIIGFGSTALLTLKYIYPSCSIASVRFHLENSQLDTTYRSIENYYHSHGIEIVEI